MVAHLNRDVHCPTRTMRDLSNNHAVHSKMNFNFIP